MAQHKTEVVYKSQGKTNTYICVGVCVCIYIHIHIWKVHPWAAVELLPPDSTSVQLLSCKSAVRRFDGAQHPCVNFLGEGCIDIPWCARSQRKAGLCCWTSSPSAPAPQNQKISANPVPWARFLPILCHVHTICVILWGLRNKKECNKNSHWRAKGSKFDTMHKTTVKQITRTSGKAGICS